MNQQNPYSIIKHQRVTEKTSTLLALKDSTSNPCTRRCEQAKYVFIVDVSANKKQIGDAIEEIYKDQQIKVSTVNTINVKGKTRRVRGRVGKTSSYKKAIVTLEKGDTIESA